MKVGNESDPRLLTDMTLTGYRDAIDYLGYYWDTYGSMVDGIGMEAHLAKKILAERATKVMGVRINCVGDQASGQPDMVPVLVPKTHPLFNLEGDNPFSIPDRLGRVWVAKAYGGKPKSDSGRSSNHIRHDLENPLARLLLLRTSVKDGRWEGLSPWWHDPEIGSIFFYPYVQSHLRRTAKSPSRQSFLPKLCSRLVYISRPFGFLPLYCHYFNLRLLAKQFTLDGIRYENEWSIPPYL